MIWISNKENKDQISRGVKSGKLKKIAPKIYIQTARAEEEEIKTNIIAILNELAPGGAIAYRSALLPIIRVPGEIIILADKNKTIKLGTTVTIMLVEDKDGMLTEGNRGLLSKMVDYDGYTVLKTKAILDNLSKAVAPKYRDFTLAVEMIKNDVYSRNGDAEKNQFLRDEFIRVGKSAGMAEEVRIALTIIDKAEKYFLETYGSTVDYKRLVMFKKLSEALVNSQTLSELSEELVLTNKISQREMEHTAFFESYFSNYIEGTKFPEDEARDIVFGANVPYERHSDGHDLLSLYRLSLMHEMNPQAIVGSDDFIKKLKEWHLYFLEHAQSKHPGEFKKRKNIAGSTFFVDPSRVETMLRYVYDIGEEIVDPTKKALFMSLAFTEVHPFDDGNGRISRLLMNMILSQSGRKRIIFPTVFRQDYNLTLKAFSSQEKCSGIVKFTEQLLTANVEMDFACSLDDTVEFLKARRAFDEDDMARWNSEIQDREIFSLTVQSGSEN
ncbi:MAG TPA: Fic family protein [Sulfuricurvum sp.]|nr:MAG: hypothetical protein B7X89_08670 [Sulfuricurvum sp. 17-40-25]HQS67484.1 Fic family protein [Sulfuricurvum sp.]